MLDVKDNKLTERNKMKLKLIAPSGKTIQQKINAILKNYEVNGRELSTPFDMEKDIINSIHSVLNKCILYKEETAC